MKQFNYFEIKFLDSVTEVKKTSLIRTLIWVNGRWFNLKRIWIIYLIGKGGKIKTGIKSYSTNIIGIL